MRVRDGHNAHGAVKNCIKAILLAALPLMGVVVSDMLPGPPLAVAVRNPAEFQEAVRGGVRHVVITEHLDMTTTPRSPNATILDAGIIAVVANEFGRHTATIRGNCSGPQTELDLNPPLDSANRQCVITVRDDFLELPLHNSAVLMSNLYVTLPVPSVKKNHTTLIVIHGGDLYMTNMTFVGDRNRARAIIVKENSRVYVSRSYFSHFSEERDAVIYLEPGARATISRSTFWNNKVATSQRRVSAAGPVMGLKAGPGKQGAAAWFQYCEFDGSAAGVPGDVAIDNRHCHVYSNTPQPRVWDRELRRQVSAWSLTLDVPNGTLLRSDVFADVETGPRSSFLRPGDEFFDSVIHDQSNATHLRILPVEVLPTGTDYYASDPYAGIVYVPTVSTGIGIGILAGLTALTALFAAWCICFQKRSNDDLARRSHVHPASSVPSTVATNARWAAEFNATFMSTTCQTDIPTPNPSDPATKQLEVINNQLNGFAKDAVILERFTLLGPDQRRQGGQGIVVFARGVHNGLGYALKFFVNRESFLAEREMYRSQTLGRLLPQVQAVYDPEDTPTALLDRLGRPLPPCIAMERGESLPDWSRRAKPDVFQSVSVLAHVATRLRDMHAAGYVHRDVKPENIMFLPRENRWTVVNFGCAARCGEFALLAYTLVYAPPEVAQAMHAGSVTIEVTPAMDAWALGVVAFELLTRQSAFHLAIEGRDSVVAKLLGKEELAWEGDLTQKHPTARPRLGLFQEPILALLHRDPSQRISLAGFCKTTNTVFSSPSTVKMP